MRKVLQSRRLLCDAIEIYTRGCFAASAESAVGEQELRERIAQRAYNLYKKRGQTHGSDITDWLEAERLVLAQLEDERHSQIKRRRRERKG